MYLKKSKSSNWVVMLWYFYKVRHRTCMRKVFFCFKDVDDDDDKNFSCKIAWSRKWLKKWCHISFICILVKKLLTIKLNCQRYFVFTWEFLCIIIIKNKLTETNNFCRIKVKQHRNKIVSGYRKRYMNLNTFLVKANERRTIKMLIVIA